MWRSRAVRRREHLWGAAAAVAIWWPGRLGGALDGAPLDRPLEAIALGVVFPALWWIWPQFLSTRVAHVAIALLLAGKAAAAITLSQDGWCVAFDTARPAVRDASGRPHSWDLRADWRSPDPRCSAIMTRAYRSSREIPAFFLNLSPPDDNLPQPEDRPPLVVFRMRVHGFLQTETSGDLSIETAAGMRSIVRVDGVDLGPPDALTRSVTLPPGLHEVEVEAVMSGNQWRLRPVWNGTELGTIGFPVFTVEPPSTLDLAARPVAGAALSVITSVLLTAWIAAWWRSIRDRLVLVIALAASTALAVIAVQGLTPLSTWAVSALALMAAVDVSTPLRNVRGVFLLVGAPWLTLVVAAHAHDIGRFSLLDAGNDWWTFQRFAYRIYLQGYWLEGGQTTFWFQPLYRWVAGALHMLFGDSHFGEFVWDGACVLAVAMLAYYVTRLAFGFRPGVLAAVLTLTMVMRGPGWLFIGRGLSEWTAAGFLCLAAQFAMRGRLQRVSIRPGAAALLGVYTRLNHLPMAAGVAAFALGCRVRVRDVLHPERYSRSLGVGVLIGTGTVLTVGLLLFAWRTWYYTGVFSVTHGTSFAMLALAQDSPSLQLLTSRMSDSLAMLLTMSDPPGYNLAAVPLLIGGGVTLGALLGAPVLRELPAAGVLFFVSGCAGSLIARGTAYPGRFSLHLLGIASALTIGTVCLLGRRARRSSTLRRRPARDHHPRG